MDPSTKDQHHVKPRSNRTSERVKQPRVGLFASGKQTLPPAQLFPTITADLLAMVLHQVRGHTVGYRCYILDGEDHIVQAHDLDCATDQEAKGRAERLLAHDPYYRFAEVWHTTRRVLKLERDVIQFQQAGMLPWLGDPHCR